MPYVKKSQLAEIEEFMYDLVDDYCRAEQDMIDECSSGQNAINCEKAINKEAIRLKLKIRNMIAGVYDG